MGGEVGVRALVDRFYDLMDQDPEYSPIRKMHPPSLAEARNKLFWFLSGWMGGPDLYVERFGHPRMRMRHMGFAIGNAERDHWLNCMRRALKDADIDDQMKQQLMQTFGKIADAVRNQPD